MPTDNHDLGRDALGGTKPSIEREEGSPGYETTDVNIGGVVVFLAGLGSFVIIFFIFCFVMGKAINTAFMKQDGPPDQWHRGDLIAGAAAKKGHREDMASSPELKQREYQSMTQRFPTPRLDIDDGNQATADLHAREDLLLEHYSRDPENNGQLRIPIERAMQLIAQRGLPVHPGPPSDQRVMVGDANRQVTMPLTDGFARTGYELDQMEARQQKLGYEHRQENPDLEAKPVRH